ncbi:MAG: hypothetical protein M3Y33_05715 [Actinomycetota bacterium]|nr:hypothetical protein [Actinomycetota bacterium]
MSEHWYRVVVTREDGHWLADVPELDGAHTYARSFPALDRAVREVVVLAAGLPDEAMPGLALDGHVPEPGRDFGKRPVVASERAGLGCHLEYGNSHVSMAAGGALEGHL